MKGKKGTRPVVARALALLALLGVAACGSPNRGTWTGTFDGDVSGVVRFEINARGTRMTGEMDGQTRDGVPFKAEMKGVLAGSSLEATFVGKGRSGILPIEFEGRMLGQLGAGRGEGEWSAVIVRADLPLSGGWSVEQLPEE